MNINETQIRDRFNKLYSNHLVNFNNPLMLSDNTKNKYKKYLKTLIQNNKFISPSEYAELNNLTYRQYSYYRTAFLQRLMLKMLESNDLKQINKFIDQYVKIKFDTYKPVLTPESEIDSKKLERVLRGLRNSNKQRKVPLSDPELKELAYNRIAEKQTKEGKVRMTKSRSLAGLSGGWQAKIREHLPAHYQDVVIAIEATGCRPWEITNNPVLIKYNNDKTITVKIFGAKISEEMEYKGGRDKSGKGQQWRLIIFSEKSQSFDKLFQLCKQRKSKKIEVQSKFKLATLQQAYRRAVKKAGFEKQQVSLYSSRHLLGCKMKTEGLDPVTIAQALGHQATSSTKKYGYVRKGSGGSGIINTACASEVRLTRVSVYAQHQGNSELLNPTS